MNQTNDSVQTPEAPADSQSPRREVLRVGVDIGFHTTVLQKSSQLSELLMPGTDVIPTWIAYNDGQDPTAPPFCIGEEALENRAANPPINPLLQSDVGVLRDFADAIRARLDPDDDKELWGVVNSPMGAAPYQLDRIRLIGHQVFDRTRILDDALLMATSFGSREIARKSIWVDIGATSSRAAAVHGGSPLPQNEAVVVPGGGIAVRERLESALGKRFPGFMLTEVTLDEIKKHFGHVEPVRQKCPLRVVFDHLDQVINIETLVKRACEPLVDQIMSCIRQVLTNCPSDSVEEFLQHIVISGGGAQIRGLAERIQQGIRSEFDDSAVVRVPAEPTALAANGALRWAHFIDEDEWEISLFTFG